MSSSFSAHDALGIAGFTFADLHQPRRLHALYELFCDDVRRTEPELWARVGSAPAQRRRLGPVARSNLIVAMAPHVSRFLTRLFSIGPEAEAMAAQTRAYDDLFRFKIDFVRRRALPLLKAGTHVEASADDHALCRCAYCAGSTTDAARELALSRAGCDAARSRGGRARQRHRRGEAGGGRRDRIAQALVRGARARSALSRTGSFSAFRKRSTRCTWCTSCGPIPALPEVMVGPEDEAAPSRRVQADRPALQPSARC